MGGRRSWSWTHSKPARQDQAAPRNSTTNSSAGNSVAASKQTQHGKVAPVHIPALEVMPDLVHGIAKDGEEVASGGEAPNNKPSSPIMQDVQMAGIPETETPGRRSKRRAETVDESSMERAEEHSQPPPPLCFYWMTKF
jgi:hypothetical protein